MVPDLKNGIESGQIKFTKQNDNVDVNAKTKLIGLTKEQIEQYRDDPLWKPIRYGLFILFWFIWVGLFLGAILIVIISPKCRPHIFSAKQKWSKNVINYQIYTPTFYDSNGDGVGDFAGIEAKLSTLQHIGVKSIQLIPVIASAKDEFSPSQVLDVLKIDERFGSTDDLKTLIKSAHAKKINVIVDVPLTVSSENAWAKQTEGAISKDRISKPLLLNVENELVQIKLFEAAKKLLHLGVDGIHLADYGCARKTQVKSLDPLIKRIRDAVATDYKIQQKDLLVIVDPEWTTTTLADNRVFSLTANVELNNFPSFVSNIVKNVKSKPIWKYSDIDSPRLDQQLDLYPNLKEHTKDFTSMLSLIQLFLPGPISIYYGEELGLPSIKPTVPLQYAQRGIMRWDASQPNFGFSSVSGKNFFGDLTVNGTGVTFSGQYAHLDSPLHIFKNLAKLRNRNPVFQFGSLGYKYEDLQLFSRYIPNLPNSEMFLLVANWPMNGIFTPKNLTLASEFLQNRLPIGMEVKVTSSNAMRHIGRKINLNEDSVLLEPFQTLIIRIP